jgi:hypothetical protein
MVRTPPQAEAIGLEGAEALLDPPAQAIEPHHLAGRLGVLRRQRGEQPPLDRRRVSRRVFLARFH